MMEHALSEDTMNRWLAYLEAQGVVVVTSRCCMCAQDY